MININHIEDIYYRFAIILEYGLINNYSLGAMEERIFSSDMFQKLENSDSSFLYSRNNDDEIRLIYSLNYLKEIIIKAPSSQALWLSEAYIRLFFKFHKSINYIFLYISIEDMLQYYHIYHEMDYSHLYGLFIDKVSSDSLLRKLMNKKQISISKLNELTNIDVSTIRHYISNDEYLYHASYMNIYALSRIFNVNSNIFIKDIGNYTNSDEYEFDKTNLKYRSYLALFLLSYYSMEIKNRKYIYDEQKGTLVWNEHIIKTCFTETKRNNGQAIKTNKEIVDIVNFESIETSIDERNNTILAIFEYNQISESANGYLELLKYGYEKIYIINQENILCIDQNYWGTNIAYFVKEFLIEKAKKAFGEDFAIR